ncbi:hypothetical protein FACS1894218_3480 [Bacilli bacterium]|nr:hypothetical protein FACS1894218_3480 [Bacilli bacterium]
MNENANNLSDSLFQIQYKEKAEQFMIQTEKRVATYLKYSERIKLYNIAHANDNQQEIDANHKLSAQYLSQVKARMKTPPAD